MSNPGSKPKKHATAKPANSDKRHFPNEIWYIVLEHFRNLSSPGELTWLWLGGRHVSQLFRIEIENFFRTIHLPLTTIRVDLGMQLLCWDIFASHEYQLGAYGTSCIRGYDYEAFVLDKMSPDETRAIFKINESRYPEVDLAFRRLHEKSLIGAPMFSIQLRSLVNDTGVPDLRIHDHERKVSFDWRGMFDQLFGEEHIFNTLSTQGLGWHLDPEYASLNIHETHRRIARRSRLQRECRVKFRTNVFDQYVHSEHTAMQGLYQLRLAAYKAESGEEFEDPEAVLGPDVYLEMPANNALVSQRWPGSVPRGIFGDRDHSWAMNAILPKPSTRDVFSQRVPDLSYGWPSFDHTTPANAPDSQRDSRIGTLSDSWNAGPRSSNPSNYGSNQFSPLMFMNCAKPRSAHSSDSGDTVFDPSWAESYKRRRSSNASSSDSPDESSDDDKDPSRFAPSENSSNVAPITNHPVAVVEAAAKNSGLSPRPDEALTEAARENSGCEETDRTLTTTSSKMPLECPSGPSNPASPSGNLPLAQDGSNRQSYPSMNQYKTMTDPNNAFAGCPVSFESSTMPNLNTSLSVASPKRPRDDDKVLTPKKRVRFADSTKNAVHLIENRNEAQPPLLSKRSPPQHSNSSDNSSGESSTAIKTPSPRGLSMHEARKIRYRASVAPTSDPIYDPDTIFWLQQMERENSLPSPTQSAGPSPSQEASPAVSSSTKVLISPSPKVQEVIQAVVRAEDGGPEMSFEDLRLQHLRAGEADNGGEFKVPGALVECDAYAENPIAEQGGAESPSCIIS